MSHETTEIYSVQFGQLGRKLKSLEILVSVERTLVLKNAGVNGWTGSRSECTFNIVHYFIDMMWPFWDGPPLDVSGYPNSCDKQSWFAIVPTLCIRASCKRKSRLPTAAFRQRSLQRAHLRLEKDFLPETPPSWAMKRAADEEKVTIQLERLHCATLALLLWFTLLVSCAVCCGRANVNCWPAPCPRLLLKGPPWAGTWSTT